MAKLKQLDLFGGFTEDPVTVELETQVVLENEPQKNAQEKKKPTWVTETASNEHIEEEVVFHTTKKAPTAPKTNDAIAAETNKPKTAKPVELEPAKLTEPEKAKTNEPIISFELPATNKFVTLQPEETIDESEPIEIPEIITTHTKSVTIILPKTPLPETDDPELTVQALARLTQTKTRGRKSIKELAANADLISVPDDETLFKKQYYTMGEVCGMFNVNHSLLRFWEAEFAVLKPRKNRKGDRLFRPEDVKNLEIIYKLTRVKKLTIQGAKEYFKNEKLLAKKYELIQQLELARTFLLEVKARL